ncbi:MAG: hypothetical protein JWM31_3576 [Solirubrobacterales bacterium]|nr:hypothetical protein [Solirubrobacterales bacterium]
MPSAEAWRARDPGTPRGMERHDDERPERDPANPTPEELAETAAAEGLMATEEETDPDFVDLRDPADIPPADVA